MTKKHRFHRSEAEQKAAAIEHEINRLLRMAMDNFLENLSENIKIELV